MDPINPARVLAFLDVAGAWNPTLAFVMGSGLGGGHDHGAADPATRRTEPGERHRGRRVMPAERPPR